MRDRYCFMRAFALHMEDHIACRSLASASSAARGPTNGIALTNTRSALMPRIYKPKKKNMKSITKCAIESTNIPVPCHLSSNWPSWQHFIRKYRESKYADYCCHMMLKSCAIDLMNLQPVQKGIR